jgi:hypothetical protein
MNVAAGMMSYKDAIASAQNLIVQYYALGVAAAAVSDVEKPGGAWGGLSGSVEGLGDANEELYTASINAYNVANGF